MHQKPAIHLKAPHQDASFSCTLPHKASIASPNSATSCGPRVHTHGLWGTSHTQTGIVLIKPSGHSFCQGMQEPSEFIQKAQALSSCLRVPSLSLTVALSNPILPLQSFIAIWKSSFSRQNPFS